METQELRCEPAAVDAVNRYRVGSLVYTPRLLIVVILWLLWGEVCLTLTDQIVTKLLPVSLKDLQASNATIGLIAPGLPCILAAMLGPAIGSASDRYRSRLGRRIPFLLVLAPCVAVFLVLVGASGRIGGALHARGAVSSPVAAIFAVMAVGAVLFQVGNSFVWSVYQYLIRDVIPSDVLGRFYGLARTVGATAGFAFNRFGLGWADTHRGLAYTMIGLAYGAGYLFVCWRVKEGRYPPPPRRPARAGLAMRATRFCRESFSHPYYVTIYLAQACYTMSTVCVHTFIVFFAKDLGMSLDSFGKAMSWTLVLGLVLNLPLGYLADRMHAIRLQILSLLVLPAVAAASFFAIGSPTSFLVWTVLWWLAHLTYMASNAPLMPLLLPAEKYGQFYSAMYLLALLGATAASYGGGLFLDLMGDYRYIYVWNTVFNIISLALTIMVYLGWKRHGGRIAYRPPEVVLRSSTDN